MKPASCFGNLASFSNRQKRLQQTPRYAVDIHNDDFRTRLLVVLLAKPTLYSQCFFLFSQIAEAAFSVVSGCTIPSFMLSITVLGVEAFRVRHKNVLHVRFHPAVTQPTKILTRPPLSPTSSSSFRIAFRPNYAGVGHLVGSPKSANWNVIAWRMSHRNSRNGVAAEERPECSLLSGQSLIL